MAEMENMNLEQLDDVVGGKHHHHHHSDWEEARAHVKTGYLALRSYPEWDDNNIIARINNNTKFDVDKNKYRNGYYWAEYDGKQGWVNGSYIKFV